jgi:hypothetical protein
MSFSKANKRSRLKRRRKEARRPLQSKPTPKEAMGIIADLAEPKKNHWEQALADLAKPQTVRLQS